MGFLLVQFTNWKWEISNLVHGLSFHLVIAKLKYMRTWNFQPKCPFPTRLRWSKVFENRLNTFGDIGFLLVQFTDWKWKISNLQSGTVYRLKVGNFKFCRWVKLSPCHCKLKYQRTWTFQPICPLSTRLRWGNVFENRWNTFGDMGFLLVQFTGWKWEISYLVDGLSFHLAIAKVKYLRTCNFRPKCCLSTCVRWSKFFENGSNSFGDIGFFLGEFTGWKWEISNLVNG